MASTSNVTLETLVFSTSLSTQANLFKLISLWHQQLPFLVYVGFVIFLLPIYLLSTNDRGDGLPVANRLFTFEPQLFVRLRWAFFARRILGDAHEKVNLLASYDVLTDLVSLVVSHTDWQGEIWISSCSPLN